MTVSLSPYRLSYKLQENNLDTDYFYLVIFLTLLKIKHAKKFFYIN